MRLLYSKEKLSIFLQNKNLLTYGGGEYLDHIGYLTDTPRLEAQSALTTFEFNLSTKLSGIYTIPAGTQISTGNSVIFQTDVLLEIPAGKTVGTVSGYAVIPGLSGNGFFTWANKRVGDSVAVCFQRKESNNI
ncbi:baseplate J/gp47 family protein [Escherichia coli]|uniref:baseplate J/gp47 family protein n=1 Tax=Escherichia coli TaxID=562 RepID=UPI0024C4DBFE|nr:baseplate J/gp47 family protein [Escherichia coli]